MPRPAFESVDDYLASQPAPARPALGRVRDTIRRAVPAADEGISYGIPAYKLDGEVVIYFAGFKQHYSVYPATDGVAQAFAKELAQHQVSKGTIRFPFTSPVPVRLIARIARFRAELARDRAKAKQAGRKKRPSRR